MKTPPVRTIDNVTYMNLADEPKPLTTKERAAQFIKGHGHRIGVTALAGAAVIVSVHVGSKVAGSTGADKAPHSISYLDSDEQEPNIIVTTNQNPTEVAQNVNGGRLHGQAELDAAAYIQRQGSGIESDGITPELIIGDTVSAPVVPDDQINQVNNGEHIGH